MQIQDDGLEGFGKFAFQGRASRGGYGMRAPTPRRIPTPPTGSRRVTGSRVAPTKKTRTLGKKIRPGARTRPVTAPASIAQMIIQKARSGPRPVMPKKLWKHFKGRAFVKPIQLKRENRPAPFIGHTRSRNEAIAWLREFAPEFVRILSRRKPELFRIASGLHGLGEPPAEAQAAATQSWTDKLLDLAKVAIPMWQQNKYQGRIIDMQLERARAGKPPLDVQQYTAPPTAVQIQTPGLNLTKMLPMVALIGAGAFLLPQLLKKRR